MKRPFFAVVILLAGCRSDRGIVAVSGSWGGPNAQMEATSSGAAFRFKCGAHGQVGSPLRLDGEGRFEQAGSYDPVVVAGGPRAAVFRGDLHGAQLTLSLDVDDTVLGPYRLARDEPARFDVCNY